MTEATLAKSWWGDFRIDAGAGGYWRLGPLNLWIDRTRREWLVAHSSSGDRLDPSLETQLPRPAGPVDPEAVVTRYAFRDRVAGVELLPELADRPIVYRAATPLAVPPGQEVTMFVSSPLWVRVSDHPSAVHLESIPSLRLSDTWFGADTRQGELCYASQTRARLVVDELPTLPNRAVSTIRVRNSAASHLLLEKIKVPTPSLTLFATPRGALWTEDIHLNRDEDGDLAQLAFGPGPPRTVDGAVQVSKPRKSTERPPLIRAFGGLFNLE